MSSHSPPSRARLAVLTAHVWLVAAAVPLLVKLLPFKALLGVLTPRPGRRPYKGVPAEAIVDRVTRRLLRPRHMRHRLCLRRSLTLFHFLRLAGHPAVLRISVYPDSPGQKHTKAHGWVTLDGVDLTAPPEGPSATVLVHGRER